MRGFPGGKAEKSILGAREDLRAGGAAQHGQIEFPPLDELLGEAGPAALGVKLPQAIRQAVALRGGDDVALVESAGGMFPDGLEDARTVRRQRRTLRLAVRDDPRRRRQAGQVQELLGQQFMGGLEEGLGRCARVANSHRVQQGRGQILQRVGPVNRLDEVEDHRGRPCQQLAPHPGEV